LIDQIETVVEGDTWYSHEKGVDPAGQYHPLLATAPSRNIMSGLVINAPALGETNFEADVSGGGASTWRD
jgi:hypothetical protein